MGEDVFSFFQSQNKTSSIILDPLELTYYRLGTARKERVAIVKS